MWRRNSPSTVWAWEISSGRVAVDIVKSSFAERAAYSLNGVSMASKDWACKCARRARFSPSTHIVWSKLLRKSKSSRESLIHDETLDDIDCDARGATGDVRECGRAGTDPSPALAATHPSASCPGYGRGQASRFRQRILSRRR